MKARNVIKVLIIAATFASAALANAAQSPLEPNYYAEKFSATSSMAATTTIVYRDMTNPLSPSYTRNPGDTGWVQSSDAIGESYVHSTNPLHPTYKRR